LSPRYIKVTVILIVVAALFLAAFLLTKTNNVHRHIDTAGKIIYLSDADSAGLPHVWLVSRDGTGAKDLTPGKQTCADPAFSPDGSQIAYISDSDGQAQIYVMDADGQNPQKVTFGSASKESPSFSQDGKMLAYLSQGTLTALNLETRQPELLLPPPSVGSSGASTAATMMPGETPSDFLKRRLLGSPVVKFSWAPNANANATGSHELSIAAVQNLEDENIQSLTILPTLDAQANVVPLAPTVTIAWAPDASRIYTAVIGVKAGPQEQLFSGILQFSPSGASINTAPLAFAKTDTFGPFNPAISPDGKRALFLVLSSPDIAHQQIVGLFGEPVDGSSPPRMAAKGSVSNVQWEPDGSHVILLGAPPHSTRHDLWVLSVGGSDPPLDLTKGSGDVTSAQWSPSLAKTN